MVNFEERPCVGCGKPVIRQAEAGPDGRVQPWQWSPVIPLCADCAHKQAIQEADQRERKEAEERLHLEREREEWIEQNDLGARLTLASMDDFRETAANRQALQIVQMWLAEERHPNLVIVGPIGAGKSYLAAIAFRQLLYEVRPWPRWVRIPKLLAMIKEGMTDDQARREAAAQYAKAKSCPVLFLDDLGKTHPGRDVSWVEDQLYGIVDERYCRMLPTVVTTEWTREALAERCGESVVSRLIDGAFVASIKQPATPYRVRRQPLLHVDHSLGAR